MITLHIAKWLADEGFGQLDSSIFWEEIPVDTKAKSIDGIWVVSRGSSLSRLNVTTQQFDIYSRFANKVQGSKKLEAILNRLQTAYGDVCELPTVEPYSTNEYVDVRIRPISGIETVGADEQDKIVRVISAEIQYNLKEES